MENDVNGSVGIGLLDKPKEEDEGEEKGMKNHELATRKTTTTKGANTILYTVTKQQQKHSASLRESRENGENNDDKND